MKITRHSDIQTFRHSDIQTFRHSDIQTFRHSVNKLFFKVPPFLLCFLTLFLSSYSLFAQAQKPTLAVLNFKSDGSLKAGQLISMSEQVASGLSRQGRYTVIDRSATKERLKEISDQQTGLYDETKTVDASKSLGAEKILIGSVTQFGNNYVITAKIVDVNTSKIDSQQKEEVASIEQITQGVESLVKKFGRQTEPVTKMGMLWRSAIFPGWGQIHSGLATDDRLERIKGFAFIGGAILAGIGLYAANSSYQSAKSDYESKNTIDTLVFISTTSGFSPLQIITYSMANSAAGKMESAANNATVASILFLGLYAVNILDVVLFGGHDGVAKNLLKENPYAKKEGFQFHISSYSQNGIGSREMYIKYDFVF